MTTTPNSTHRAVDLADLTISVTLGGTSGTASHSMVGITVDPEDEVETEAVD